MFEQEVSTSLMLEQFLFSSSRSLSISHCNEIILLSFFSVYFEEQAYLLISVLSFYFTWKGSAAFFQFLSLRLFLSNSSLLFTCSLSNFVEMCQSNVSGCMIVSLTVLYATVAFQTKLIFLELPGKAFWNGLAKTQYYNRNKTQWIISKIV